MRWQPPSATALRHSWRATAPTAHGSVCWTGRRWACQSGSQTAWRAWGCASPQVQGRRGRGADGMGVGGRWGGRGLAHDAGVAGLSVPAVVRPPHFRPGCPFGCAPGQHRSAAAFHAHRAVGLRRRDPVRDGLRQDSVLPGAVTIAADVPPRQVPRGHAGAAAAGAGAYVRAGDAGGYFSDGSGRGGGGAKG
jgi:hypothetical protein